MHFETYRPRYNIAPGDRQPVVTGETPDRIVGHEWGLRPHWMDANQGGFINARSETVAEKPSFADAWVSRPCLVLSSGFYEWQERPRGPKQPYRIYRPDDPAFAFAGIWELAPNGEQPDTVTILTTEANELVEPIHERMPVILPRDAEDRWLSGDPAQREALCRPYQGEDLDAYTISRAVNQPSNDDPSIIEPTDDPQTGLDAFS